MGYVSRYDRGDWKAICDSCGMQFKASELRLRWDGLMVDSKCWEPRQPQDFVRGVADVQAPVWTRPEQQNQFVPVTYEYDPYGNSLFPGLLSRVNTSLGIAINRLITIVSSVVTSTASVLKVLYPKAANNKTLDGNTINTNTLG